MDLGSDPNILQDNVRVAAAQITPVYMDKEGTIDKACKAIHRAGKNHADLIVFSETFIPGYPYWRGLQPISRWTEFVVDYQKNSLVIPSSDTDVIGDAARGAGIHCVIGCTELDNRPGSSSLYNTLVFIDDEGDILGKHRKLMPTHAERMIWGMGDGRDLRIFKTRLGTLGGLICYEHHMTLLKAAMTVKGEEIHCAGWPGWWMMEGHPGAKRRLRAGERGESSCDIEPAIRQYAFETQNFVVSVSGYVPDKELPDECADFNVAAGGSAIVNPAGLFLAGPVFDKEEIIYATLDADERRATKAYFDALGHYSRWDVVRLDLREEGWDPTTSQIDNHQLAVERLAQEYGLPEKRLETLLKKEMRRSSKVGKPSKS